MSCYRYEEVSTPARDSVPLLRSVSTCVVLAMEGSSRMPAVRSQLATHRFATSTYIQFNRGWRDCEKRGVGTTAADLFHAWRNVCRRFPHGATLVLEDDFTVIPEKLHRLASVDQFLLEHAGTYDIYSLGIIPLVSVPGVAEHRHILLGAASQAVVLSERAKATLAAMPDDELARHIDLHMMARLRAYAASDPIIVQAFPLTENMQTCWMAGVPPPLDALALRAMTHFLHSTGADANGRPLFELCARLGTVGGVCPSLALVLLAGLLLISRLLFTRR